MKLRTLGAILALSLASAPSFAQTCGPVCPAVGLTTAFEYIRVVDIGPIFNFSGDNGGYADFGTTFGGTFNAGSFYGYSMAPGFPTGPFSEGWRVWIDLNQDGDFLDAGEEVVNDFGTSVSGSFLLPSTAVNGQTTMRVAMSFGGPVPCEDVSEGEIEDYCITITGGVAPSCDASSPVTGLTSTVNATDVVLSWNPVNLSVGCQVTGGLVPDLNQNVRRLGTEISSISIPQSILSPGDYNWMVKCACSISPLDLTPDSAIDTFSIPALRGTAAINVSQIETSISPNPASEVLRIEIAEVTGNYEISVMDMLGRQLLSSSTSSSLTELDIRELASGSYMLILSQNNQTLSSKLFSKE